jgi:hypothetical protein
MTLCELRTAEFHSIPLECELFLEEGGSIDSAPHGICVEWACLFSRSLQFFTQPHRALSRSTQSWASYSGYLREIRTQVSFVNCFLLTVFLIAQLCFAYQRSNEKGAELGAMALLVRSDLRTY